MTGYETKTMKRLFEQYQEENSRIDEKDRELTKKLICREIYRRVKRSLDALDKAESKKEAEQIYKQFIEF